MNKLILLIGVFVFLISNNLSSQTSNLPWIKVEGNKLLKEDGSEIVFKGINTSDPDKLAAEGHWDLEYFREIKSWGANLVRFPIHPSAWNERGQDRYMELLDEGIEFAKEMGMYVILDWHSIGNLRSELFQHEMYNTTKRETYEFWRLMAKKYGSEPTVAFFELYNEPTTFNGQLGVATWEQWKEIMEELIIIVRANGAKNIPLVAGFNWAYDLTPVATNPIEAEGIAYVSHPYPQKREKPWAEKWDKDFGFVAQNYPVLLTEVGFCAEDAVGAHIPVISDPSYVDELMKYSKERGISFVVWVFDPKWSPMLIEDWTFKPTDAGKVWKEKMSKK